MINNGCILLSRNLLESEVFASQKMLKIWIWCLIKSNYKDRFVDLKIGRGYKTVKVKRGSFIFGRFSAEEELFIDGSTIYKIIKKLEKIGNISIKSNNQYSIITICNYDTYQDIKEYKVAAKEQPKNQISTTKEQPKNTNNNVNNVNKDKKNIYRQFDHLKITIEDNNKLIEEGYKQFEIDNIYNKIENYKQNKKYKSLYLTSLNWLRNEYKERSSKPKLSM